MIGMLGPCFNFTRFAQLSLFDTVTLIRRYSAPTANEVSVQEFQRDEKQNGNVLNNEPRPAKRPWTSAIMENGKILGIPCGNMFARKSNPAIPGTPESLQPTLLQLSNVHWAWIDKFPFPDFRDEIILHSGMIDEEEFLEDLFAMDALIVAPGGVSWDPNAYSINPQFHKKWGYLFPSFSQPLHSNPRLLVYN